jgi:hypothetical protein
VVHRVILYIQLADTEALGEAVAAHQRRKSGVEPGARRIDDRQQLAIAPQVFRTALDLLARQANRRVVIDRLERPQALLANVQGCGRELRLAQMTLQTN